MVLLNVLLVKRRAYMLAISLVCIKGRCCVTKHICATSKWPKVLWRINGIVHMQTLLKPREHGESSVLNSWVFRLSFRGTIQKELIILSPFQAGHFQGLWQGSATFLTKSAILPPFPPIFFVWSRKTYLIAYKVVYHRQKLQFFCIYYLLHYRKLFTSIYHLP